MYLALGLVFFFLGVFAAGGEDLLGLNQTSTPLPTSVHNVTIAASVNLFGYIDVS